MVKARVEIKEVPKGKNYQKNKRRRERKKSQKKSVGIQNVSKNLSNGSRVNREFGGGVFTSSLDPNALMTKFRGGSGGR